MTDNETPKEPSEIDKLKAAYDKEFAEFKLAVQKETESNAKIIADLKKDNEDLRAALVKASRIPAPVEKEVPKEKTPEEIYTDAVKTMSDKTLKIMKEDILGVR